MPNELSVTTKRLLLVTLIIAAILFITFLPTLTTDMINKIDTGLYNSIEKLKAEGTPESLAKAAGRSVAVWQIALQYLAWANIIFIAGIALLAILKPFYNGKTWAKGLVLLCLAVAAITGAYTIQAWFNIVVRANPDIGFPPSIVLMIVSLIPYFFVVLATKKQAGQKIIDFFVFLLTGVGSGTAFLVGVHAFKAVYSFPQKPLLAADAPTLWLAMLLSSFLLLASIFQLGAGRNSGWYTAFVGSTTMLIASAWTHFFVRQPNNNYLFTAIGFAVFVVLLLLPQVKKYFVSD